MKKILYLSILFIFFIGGILLGYVFVINTIQKVNNTDSSILNMSVVSISKFDDDEVSKLSIINLQKLLQTESVSIDYNDDPGVYPSEDYFDGLGKLQYPLKELEITDSDDIIIIIKPHPELKPSEFDAYIACNTEIAKQAKDKLYYFSTQTGTTPAFNISIYKNGYYIDGSGVLGLHLSELENEFKPIKRINDVSSSSVVTYISCGIE